MVTEELFGAYNFVLEVSGTTHPIGFTQKSEAKPAALTTLGSNLQAEFRTHEELKGGSTWASVAVWADLDWDGIGAVSDGAGASTKSKLWVGGADAVSEEWPTLMPIEDVFSGATAASDTFRFAFAAATETGEGHTNWIDIVVVQPLPQPGGSVTKQVSNGHLRTRGEQSDAERYETTFTDDFSGWFADTFDFVL